MRSNSGRIPRHGYAAKGPKIRAVTASRFQDARLTCGLSVPAAAKLLRVTERTLQNWETGKFRVPYAAYKLMRILRGHEFPDSAWKGFRVVGDTLWSPEGYAFKPAHMAWWSLTCRMADQFRFIMRSDAPVLVVAPPVVASAQVGDTPARAHAFGAPAGDPASPPARPVVPSANRGLKTPNRLKVMQSDANLHQAVHP